MTIRLAFFIFCVILFTSCVNINIKWREDHNVVALVVQLLCNICGLMCIILCSYFNYWMGVCIFPHRIEDGNNTCECSILFGPCCWNDLKVKKTNEEAALGAPPQDVICPFDGRRTRVARKKGSRRVVEVYDDRSQCFKIVESMVSFRAEDVTLILGLCCDGDTLSFKHESVQSNFEKNFLHKMHNRHRDAIKENLFKLVLHDYDIVPQYFSKCPSIHSKVRCRSSHA